MSDFTLTGFPSNGIEPERILRELERAACSGQPIDARSPLGSASPQEIARHVAAQFVGVRADSDPFTRNIEADLKQTVVEALGIPGAQCFLTGSGTESNLLGLFVARDAAARHRRRLLGPKTLHTSVYKCAALLDVALETVDVDPDRRVNVGALRKAMTAQMFAVVASAPSWDSGAWDPVEQIGALAAERRVHFHVDACIGGFLLPFLPASDLPGRLSMRGICSVALDLHKFAYAPFSLSALCFPAPYALENLPLPRATSEEPVPKSLASDRPFWPIAAAWAITKMLGRAGYEKFALALIARRARICDAFAKRDIATAGDTRSPIIRVLASQTQPLDTLERRFTRAAVSHIVCPAPGHIRLRVDPLLDEPAFEQLLSKLDSL